MEEVIKKFGTIAFMRSASIDEVVAHFNMKAREQLELEAENKRLHEEVRKLTEETHRTFLYDGPPPPTGTPTEGA